MSCAGRQDRVDLVPKSTQTILAASKPSIQTLSFHPGAQTKPAKKRLYVLLSDGLRMPGNLEMEEVHARTSLPSCSIPLEQPSDRPVLIFSCKRKKPLWQEQPAAIRAAGGLLPHEPCDQGHDACTPAITSTSASCVDRDQGGA